MRRSLLYSRVLVFIAVASAGVCAFAQSMTELPVSYICIEVETGLVLMEEHADVVRPPASMLKMMQMLLVEEGVQAGKWTYDTPVSVSALAESTGGSQVFLARGETWPLRTLMEAIAVASANDASVAVAEGLWGSVDACLAAMNQRAAELGMADTLFHSVNGLPPSDGKSFDMSTARDMAILGRALLYYPRLIEFTQIESFSLRPDNSPRSNTNRLITRMPGCDGLKTGYIRAAGFCLTATAHRNGIRLIAVVMGSDRTGRFDHTQEILEEGFDMVQRVAPVRAGATIGRPVAVVRGLAPDVTLVAQDDIQTVIRHVDLEQVMLEITAPTELEAPVEAGAEAGKVRLVLHDNVLGETTLVIAEAVERKRLKHRLRAFIGLEP